MDSQGINNPTAHSANLFSVLRYIGKCDAVPRLSVTNSLNQLTKTSSKVKAWLGCFPLSLNMPALRSVGMRAQEINMTTYVNRVPEPEKISLYRSLDESLGGKLNTPPVAARNRHGPVRDA
jgi:hypothetical protein